MKIIYAFFAAAVLATTPMNTPAAAQPVKGDTCKALESLYATMLEAIRGDIMDPRYAFLAAEARAIAIEGGCRPENLAAIILREKK